MKRIIGYAITVVVLTGAVVLCCIRWNAWFGNPQEPAWETDTLRFCLPSFGRDSVKGFVKYDGCWYNTSSPDTLRFIVLGDVHNGIDSTLWVDMFRRHPNIDFYAQLGDFLERGYFYYYQQLLSELEGTPFISLPVIATPGNHEYRKGIIRQLPEQWNKWFVNPANGPERFEGSTYYVDFAGLRFIAIDTNGLQLLSDFTTTLTWLNNTLQEAGDKFTIVIMHHPVYSGAVGRQNVPVYLTFRRTLQNADIVFSGHDHNYYRRLPFIGLNSAKKFYLGNLDDDDARICSGRQLYELCTLANDSLTVETFLADGTLYDRFGIARTETGGHQYFFSNDSLPAEIIDLPEKYRNSDSRKTRRFLLRRQERLQTEE